MGNAVSEAAVLRRLVRMRMSGPSDRGDSGIERADDPAVARVYFLLGAGPAGSIEEFATLDLPALVQYAHRRVEMRHFEVRGEVRGRVLWAATAKRRCAGDHDPTACVCRRADPRFDTPENQLLTYMVRQIERAILSVPAVMASGFAVVADRLAPGDAPTANRLVRIASALTEFHRAAAFRRVTIPEQIDGLHLARARVQKLRAYQTLADLYDRRLVPMILSPPADRLAALGRGVLLLPGATGRDADPWIRLAARVMA